MSRILRREPLRRPAYAVDHGPHRAQAVVVTFHGGPEHGFGTTRTWSAPYLRMMPFGREIRRRSGGRIAVVRVRHTQTGWNGGEQTTLGQARWLLSDLALHSPDLPVGLLGHSLGGRTALAAGDADQVRSIVALAPWVTEHDPVDHLTGRHVLVVQGDSDRVCPPADTRAYVDRLRAAGGDVRLEMIPGCGHGMIRHFDRWHDLAADHLVRTLLPTG